VLGALIYVLQGLQPALHTLVHGMAGGGLRFGITLGRILTASAIPGPPPGRGGKTQARRPANAGLVLRRLSFRYGPHAEPVVDAFDLDVPDGGRLAIVGASGIGKSTLAALMAGLLRPDEGEVRLGGVPVAELAGPVLAGHRVLIPQEAYVFSGTLADNLGYLTGSPVGQSAMDRPAMDRAVLALGAGHLIERLGGYPAVLDPATLSAGERQLLALIRAYLSPARLVILDEATCHLDPAAEATVERAFADRPGSLIVIAHRISSARRTGRVLLLDGPGTALGSHRELIAGSARYRELVGCWDGEPLREPAGQVVG
jgi:ATP-binding cassette subfamily C protein